MVNTSYRPRNPGHDYYGRGTYLITVVVSGRSPLLGVLGDDAKRPQVVLSPLGQAVKQAWEIDEIAPVNGVPSRTDYSRFHSLNTLAAEICAFNGNASIIRQQSTALNGYRHR